MKFLISILFLSFSVGICAGEFDFELLSKAKFKLVSGDLGMAEFYLNQINDRETPLSSVKKRYQATIEFVRGQYKKSNLILSDIQRARALDSDAYYPEICLLKILNAMALNDTETIRAESSPCSLRTAKFSKNGQYWLDLMIKLKLQKLQELSSNILLDSNLLLTENETTKLWLKTGLYLNREQDILKQLAILDEESYQSKQLREIISFMYMRKGDLDKALAFIDDIDSANSENIKGNISLQKKEYEIAFGHFKLAMQKKQDSVNSLERVLPLSWLLNQFEDGLKYIQSPALKYMDPRNKRGIKIAYLIRLRKFVEAERELTLLNVEYRSYPPRDIHVMDSFLSIVNSGQEVKYDQRHAEDAAEKACRAFDGFNCWLAIKLNQWENLGKTIRRNDDTFSDKSMTIESLKSPMAIKPLVEQMNVDQRDIEELDSNSIIFKK